MVRALETPQDYQGTNSFVLDGFFCPFLFELPDAAAGSEGLCPNLYGGSGGSVDLFYMLSWKPSRLELLTFLMLPPTETSYPCYVCQLESKRWDKGLGLLHEQLKPFRALQACSWMFLACLVLACAPALVPFWGIGLYANLTLVPSGCRTNH